MLQLGVLDQSPVASNSNPVEAMKNTITLAKAADRLGFSRYWVAEHHSTPGLAGSSPEVLAAAIAAQTERIRVGSGGVLLPHYSPYKVAENFRVLEALYPGRIDLGIGRAPGGMPLASLALRYGRQKEPDERFLGMLLELASFLGLGNWFPDDHPFGGLLTTPLVDTAPDVWLLGSSDYSARVAAELGAGFSFAHFINGAGGHDAVRYYMEHFRPGPFGDRPRASVCVAVICAETAEKAEEFASAYDLRLLFLDKGERHRLFPSPEEVRSYPYTEMDRMIIRENRRRMIVGDPDKVRSELLRFSEEYGVHEILVNTMIYDFRDRLRSYELLAEMFLR